MTDTKISKRYAKALFDLAKDQNCLSLVNNDLSSILAIYFQSEDFRSRLSDPIASKSTLLHMMEIFFKDRAHSLTYLFLKFLVEKRRLNFLPQVCEVFAKFFLEHENITEAFVTSHAPLEQGQVDELRRHLKEKMNKEIHLHLTVVPELLGGFKIQVGDFISDDSFQTQLEQFRNILINR